MKSVIPSELQSYYDDWKMSPGLMSNGHIYFTGFTGVDRNGTLPSDPAHQIRNVFDKIGLVLREAGIGYDSIVEMTSYHVRLQEHLDTFKLVRSQFVREPYPAWTAIEVVGLVHLDAIVEIRVVAKARE